MPNRQKMSNFKYHPKKHTQSHVDTQNYPFSLGYQNVFQEFRYDNKVLCEREQAYDMSKIDLAKEMIKRAIRKGIKFRYVLADSWFTNKEFIRFIHSRHIQCLSIGSPLANQLQQLENKIEEGVEIGDLFCKSL